MSDVILVLDSEGHPGAHDYLMKDELARLARPLNGSCTRLKTAVRAGGQKRRSKPPKQNYPADDLSTLLDRLSDEPVVFMVDVTR